MLITDKNEIVRLKLIYGGRIGGQVMSVAEFTPREENEICFLLEFTPKLNVPYIAVLVSNVKKGFGIYYLEMDGEPCPPNRFGGIPCLFEDKFVIRMLWESMTGGDN